MVNISRKRDKILDNYSGLYPNNVWEVIDSVIDGIGRKQESNYSEDLLFVVEVHYETNTTREVRKPSNPTDISPKYKKVDVNVEVIVPYLYKGSDVSTGDYNLGDLAHSARIVDFNNEGLPVVEVEVGGSTEKLEPFDIDKNTVREVDL